MSENEVGTTIIEKNDGVDQYVERHASYISGLGRHAVIYNIYNSFEKIYSESFLDEEDNKSHQISRDKYVRSKINDARVAMKLDTNLAAEFCDVHPISPWLKQTLIGDMPLGIEKQVIFNSKNTIGSIASRITKKSYNRHGSAESSYIVDSLLKKKMFGGYKVSDETFLNFLEWYNHAHVQTQNESKEKVDSNKLNFITLVDKSVQDGWMPKSVVNSRLPKLDQVHVAMDDGYGFNDESRYSAYANFNYRNRIFFNPLSYKRSQIKSNIISDTYIHEACHAIADEMNNNMDRFDDIFSDIFKAVFYRDIFGKIINEAITEHIAQSLKFGSVDIIDPINRSQDNTKCYFSERNLLNTLCNKGYKKIDIRNFINTYFEDDNTAVKLGSKSAREVLISNLVMAFPSEMLNKRNNKFKDVDAFNKYLIEKYNNK